MMRRTAPRGAFTMIELLMVVAIIAILAGLLVVGISRVTRSAKQAATATEIGQISTAIGAFKAKMNVGFIPAGGVVDKTNPTGMFRLRPQYSGTEFEAIYLKQLFPQLPGCTGNPAESTGLPNVDLDPNQTLVFFLTGGSNVISNANPGSVANPGFSTNRTAPFTPLAAGSNENRIGPFLEFPLTRYATGRASPGGNGAAFSLVDRWGSPFAYFAYNPMVNKYDLNQSFTFNNTTVSAYVMGGKPLNAKGFQIISAGDNGSDDTPPYGFGPGGTNWTPGAGPYAEGQAGADDLSNFNQGPLVNTKE